MKQKKVRPHAKPVTGQKKNTKLRDHTTPTAIPQHLARLIFHDVAAVLYQNGAPLRHLRPDPRVVGVYE